MICTKEHLPLNPVPSPPGCSQLLSTKALVSDSKRMQEMLPKTMNDLEQFNQLAVGSELQMIEPRRDVNVFLPSMGRQEEYEVPTSEKS